MIQPPEVSKVGGLYHMEWKDEKVILELDRIIEHNDDIRAQLTALSSKNGHPLLLSQFNFNLSSLQARDKAAKFLRERYEVEWNHILERACWEVLKILREGEPRIDLSMNMDVTPTSWLLKPLLPKNTPTMIFADGGSGKSIVSLIIAMILGLPWQDNPLKLKPPDHHITILLLDWETDKDTVAKRLGALCRAYSISPPNIEYRRCVRPLSMDMAAIQKHVLESKAELLIIDSLGMACGGDLKEQVQATAFFQSLRELKITSLLLTHVAKDELRPRKTAFGSVYFANHSRSVWELKKIQEAEADTIKMALFHRKSNESRLQKPIGMELTFSDFEDDSASLPYKGKISFKSFDIGKEPELAKDLPLRGRLNDILKKGPRTLKALYALVEAIDDNSKKKVRATLTAEANRVMFVKKGDMYCLRAPDDLTGMNDEPLDISEDDFDNKDTTDDSNLPYF